MQITEKPIAVEKSDQFRQTSKVRAPRNRTLTIGNDEKAALLDQTISLSRPVSVAEIEGRVIHQDIFECAGNLPDSFIDLLIIDPPYNLNKVFGGTKFSRASPKDYEEWLNAWLSKLVRCLKPTASIYVCCDWQSSASVQAVLQSHFIVRNRITWEREKGRGASANWKNCSEDIWFCTMSKDYFFNVEAVKLKKKVIAPYRDKSGAPKDWQETDSGNFRLTHPSNLWTDISIPFWSMPENTDHPTQKPEKLLAKLILASSRQGDFVFDPFLGSGSTCVTAKKLGRRFSGVEIEADYCCMAVKRLALAEADRSIQGYRGGYFWERNSLSEQKFEKKRSTSSEMSGELFDE
ncbi:DNA-methyltransferase [Methylococcus capsulatus]|uniref:Methyltransferase n=1 Tax=Methylococcus capsulatus TaxID=414 RepID=A0AA35XTJ1_METCP|nr:site-specific DNA-methyltransferase [Methylococcus capsulatus]CAI8801582.1 adenine-specific DNA-methyltransferase [Methylococcus capsulatus]